MLQNAVGRVARKHTLNERRVGYLNINAYLFLRHEIALDKRVERLRLIATPVYPQKHRFGSITPARNIVIVNKEGCRKALYTIACALKKGGVTLYKLSLWSRKHRSVNIKRHTHKLIKSGTYRGIVRIVARLIGLRLILVFKHTRKRISHSVKNGYCRAAALTCELLIGVNKRLYALYKILKALFHIGNLHKQIVIAVAVRILARYHNDSAIPFSKLVNDILKLGAEIG